MDNNCCKNCGHYHQHYALNEKRIFRVYCGHCAMARIKKRLPDTPACEHFVPASADEDAFATKEYLSKVLLEYMLKLELLPQINTMAERRRKR